jgi:hypothetical protein
MCDGLMFESNEKANFFSAVDMWYSGGAAIMRNITSSILVFGVE